MKNDSKKSTGKTNFINSYLVPVVKQVKFHKQSKNKLTVVSEFKTLEDAAQHV